MQRAIVIPARMASTRFPGKPLCDLMGKPMVQWVWEAAVASGTADRVVVATPDPEILDACRSFGAEALITRNDHPSGTDRIAEVAEKVEADVYVNVQGDEPLIAQEDIVALAELLAYNAERQVGSLYAVCPDDEVDNPAVVKVVVAGDRALYFSRHAIPYPRNPRVLPVFKHIGMYAYRKPALEAFVKQGPTPLELTESLEQLRYMEMGFEIAMAKGSGSKVAVDTPEQAEQVRAILGAER